MKDSVLAAKDYIEQQFQTIFRAQEIARAVGCSYESLRKAFAREFEMPLERYLHKVRVDAAKPLILVGKKLYTVAREVGYQNELTFTRHFKRITGLNPSDYRRNRTNGSAFDKRTLVDR